MCVHVVNFSGGKDSTAMLLLMLEAGLRVDRVVCVDTTKEFPEMYEHIEKVKGFIYPVTIDTLRIDFDYWFQHHVKTRGKRKGEKGYGFPDFRNRWCTALKRKAINDYYKQIDDDVVEYHGIAFDEQDRVLRNLKRATEVRYPLVECRMSEAEALRYCYDKGFTWGGLYEKFNRVSCWCCPLSRMDEFRVLYEEYPLLWNKLREMSAISSRRFLPNYTVEQLEAKFQKSFDAFNDMMEDFL